MKAVPLVLAILSSLLLGAHLFLAGHVAFAVVVALSPSLLAMRRTWATRALQLVLAIGAMEWLRTLARLVDVRRAHGLPFLRLALILGAVAAVTVVAALLVRPRLQTAERAS